MAGALLEGLQEVNLLEHPFRATHAHTFHTLSAFDHAYYDDPHHPLGYQGYEDGVVGIEGGRSFASEAAECAVPGVRTVLDVGCAKGFVVRALRRLGVEAWGIDPSAYAIAHAPEEVRPYVRVGAFLDAEVEGPFDLVRVDGVMVYMTLTEVRAVLAKAHRIARRLHVENPTAERILGLYEAHDTSGLDPLRKQELPLATWGALLGEAGFVPEGRPHVWRAA